MQVPKRKPGKYANQAVDYNVTQQKFDELESKLKSLVGAQPRLAQEVHRLAQLGDFSENAAYQMAKGKLRGVNAKITELQEYLKRAVIIQAYSTGVVGLGNRVTIAINDKEQVYLILGSKETDPLNGVISNNSPIGSALMGHRVGDVVEVHLGNKTTECEILKIGN